MSVTIVCLLLLSTPLWGLAALFAGAWGVAAFLGIWMTMATLGCIRDERLWTGKPSSLRVFHVLQIFQVIVVGFCVLNYLQFGDGNVLRDNPFFRWLLIIVELIVAAFYTVYCVLAILLRQPISRWEQFCWLVALGSSLELWLRR